MKKFLVLFVFGLLLVSVASAELLTTANPIGKGKWAFEGCGLQDQNVGNNSKYTMTTYGGYVGYGVTDKLSAYLQYGMSDIGGLPKVDGAYLAQPYLISNPALAAFLSSLPGSVQTKTGITTVGLSGTYAILEESAGMPVALAIGAGYRTLNWTMTMPSLNNPNPLLATQVIGVDSTLSGSQMMVGLGVSKLIIPFIPYGALAYRSTTQDSKAYSTQIDVTVGTAIAWSMHGAVLIEYTNQSITPDGGSASTSGQYAVGVAYKI